MGWILGWQDALRVFPCCIEQQLCFSGFALRISSLKVALTIKTRRFISF